VLKITVGETDEITKFTLEGKLSGPWVKELDRVWVASRASSQAKLVAVDISGVTFIDSEGQQLLARMYRRGAKIEASGCMNRGIVERIEQGQSGGANGAQRKANCE
jgi:anti-anti-sigma regulatory factor